MFILTDIRNDRTDFDRSYRKLAQNIQCMKINFHIEKYERSSISLKIMKPMRYVGCHILDLVFQLR